METLFDDQIDVHYGFVWLAADYPEDNDLGARGKQTNGLLVATVPHALSMVTGLHTGSVAFRVEWHDSRPPDDAAWTDVVEASVEIDQEALVLGAFEEFHELVLPATGWHRARYNAAGMDEGKELDTTDEDEAGPDRYLLQLWPAPAASDAVIRQTSEIAAYWHGVARSTEG